MQAKKMLKGKRDATSLKVMEYVVGDEHTFDFWVQWTAPNGKVKAVRPKLVAWLDSPRASPPFAAEARNAAYFVPASLPLIVPCSIPRMVSCSSRGTFAFVADAPSDSIDAAISEPVVLNCCTDFEMPAENISPNSRSLISAYSSRYPLTASRQ